MILGKMRRERWMRIFELKMAITIVGIELEPFEHFFAAKVTTKAKSSNPRADFAYVVARMSMVVPAICLC
jgi:hypothetical protein